MTMIRCNFRLLLFYSLRKSYERDTMFYVLINYNCVVVIVLIYKPRIITGIWPESLYQTTVNSLTTGETSDYKRAIAMLLFILHF